MAKSLRSKWKRKMRAIKRVRYDAKNLEKMKVMLAEAVAKEDAQKEEKQKLNEDQMLDADPASTDDGEKMAVDKSKFNPRTFKDEDNKYPAWMNRRAIKRVSMKVKKSSLKKKKAKSSKTPKGWKVRLPNNVDIFNWPNLSYTANTHTEILNVTTSV